MTTLRACYDLALSPPTYDFVGFPLWAESERLARGAEDIEIVVLPGPAHGFRKDGLPPFSVEERRRMLRNIVLPMAGLLPSCSSASAPEERPAPAAGEIGRGAKHYGTRLFLTMFSRGLFPLRAPQPVRREEPFRRYATITLREADWWPSRNSNLEEWLKVAAWLAANGITPVFVRDTAKAAEPLRFEAAPRASLDLTARANLYAGAMLNLFVNNGPAWMCFAMGLPLLVTKMLAPEAPCATPEFFRACGLVPGSQVKGARPGQRILWDDDRAEAIIPAVDAMLEMAV